MLVPRDQMRTINEKGYDNIAGLYGFMNLLLPRNGLQITEGSGENLYNGQNIN